MNKKKKKKIDENIQRVMSNVEENTYLYLIKIKQSTAVKKCM